MNVLKQKIPELRRHHRKGSDVKIASVVIAYDLSEKLNLLETFGKPCASDYNSGDQTKEGMTMPIYEYRCRKCGNVFEKFASISSYSREVDCPACGEIAELKISGGTGLIFKGSGFYITDYKKNGSNSKETKKEKKSPDNKSN